MVAATTRIVARTPQIIAARSPGMRAGLSVIEDGVIGRDGDKGEKYRVCGEE